MKLLRIALLVLLALGAPAAADDISNWSPVDASNTRAPPNGWPVGMLPSQVRPTAQAMMGAIRRFYDTVTVGGAPATFYVNNSSGVDAGNTRCASATPCLTINQAVTNAIALTLGGQATISIAYTGTTYIESVAINGVARGQVSTAPFTSGAALPLITFVGTGGAVVINNNASYCYTLLTNDGAMAALGGGLQVEATNNGCASPLYSQFGGTWFNNGHDTLGPAAGNYWIGEEGGYFFNTPGCNASCDGYLAFAGATTQGLNATAGSGFDSDSSIACSGTPAVSAYLLWASVNSYIKSFATDGLFGAGCTVSGSPARFRLDGSSTIELVSAPNWPTGATFGFADTGSHYLTPDNQSCIGGSGGCNETNMPTGLGAGGTAINAANLGVRGGTVELQVGSSGSMAIGIVYVGFPYYLLGGVCEGQWNVGSASLQNGAQVFAQGIISGVPSIYFAWNNSSVALPAGSNQFITYICSTVS